MSALAPWEVNDAQALTPGDIDEPHSATGDGDVRGARHNGPTAVAAPDGRGRVVRGVLAALVLVTLVVAIRVPAVDQPLGPRDGVQLPPTDLDRVKPGDSAPDFTLEDQDGRPVTLSAFRNHLPVVLVFYRGHW